MLSKSNLQEIQKIEKAGMNVSVVDKSGNTVYSTVCDQCSAFKLLPDPDPNDWFRDTDMMAVCYEVKVVIAGALEDSSECTNIKKPLYCPKLGRELNEEEKKMAEEQLKRARERAKSRRLWEA